MKLRLYEGMEYKQTWGGKLRPYRIDKIGPVVTESSCWGNYKAQYVWITCLDPSTPFLSIVTSYGEVKEAVAQWQRDLSKERCFIEALNERSSWNYIPLTKIPKEDQEMLVYQLNSEKILRGETPCWTISDLSDRDYILYDTFGVATGLDSTYIYSFEKLLEIAIHEGWWKTHSDT